MISARVPPHDLGAEESLLGSMMLSKGATACARDAGVTSASFYRPAFGVAFDAIVAVNKTGANADPVLVAAELDHRGQLDALGGRITLDRMCAATPASANAPHYARIVVEQAQLRDVIARAAELQEYAYGENTEGIARALDALGEIDAASEAEGDWVSIPMQEWTTGEPKIVTPDLLRRTDDKALFYRGCVNWVHGDSGAGKSWVSGVAAAQELIEGYAVIWVDFEDPNPLVLIERLRVLGVSDAAIIEELHYFAPKSEFSASAVARIVECVVETSATLVVIDSLGEAFGLEGIDENHDAEVAPWLRRVARVIADAGPVVLIIDHSTKAKDNPLYPSGSKRKRAAVTGSSFLLEAVQPLTREHGGRIKLTCAKDRHGHYARGEVAATIDMRVDHRGVSVRVWPPFVSDSAHNANAAKLQRIARSAVSAAKEADRPLSKNELTLLMEDGGTEAKRAGIDAAVADGALRVEKGERNARLHAYVRDLTEPEDSQNADRA